MGGKLSVCLLVFSAASWIVALAGVAALEAKDGTMSWQLGFSWWAVWFQFVLLILVGANFLIKSLGLRRLCTYLLLLCTGCWMIVANDAQQWINSSSGYPYAGLDMQANLKTFLRPLIGRSTSMPNYEAASSCILAGAILVLFFNFLFLTHWSFTEPMSSEQEPEASGHALAPEPEAKAAHSAITVASAPAGQPQGAPAGPLQGAAKSVDHEFVDPEDVDPQEGEAEGLVSHPANEPAGPASDAMPPPIVVATATGEEA